MFNQQVRYDHFLSNEHCSEYIYYVINYIIFLAFEMLFSLYTLLLSSIQLYI